MTEEHVLPELKQVLGAMVFGSGRTVSVAEMRRVMVGLAGDGDSAAAAFGAVRESDIRRAIEELDAGLRTGKTGFHLAEVAGGYRLQSDAACGPWLRRLLDVGRPNRLSAPALETLAIIAYRQPTTRSEIERVRGVNVDHMVRSLLETQLIRIEGRSELPGRPLLYGTTQLFLDHFGLKNVKELPGIEELCRIETAKQEGAEPPPSKTAGADGESDEKEPQDTD